MNIEDYKATLKHLDWWYEYSDDFSAYSRGREAVNKARQLAKTSVEHQQAFDEAYNKAMN